MAPSVVGPQRIIRSLAFLLAISLAVSLILGASEMQEFAAFGATKRVTLPLVYLTFTWLWVTAASGKQHLPVWAWLPSVGIIVAFLGSAALPQERSNLSSVLQGMALFVSFTLTSLVGLRSGPWELEHRQRLTLLLVAGGVVAGVLARLGLTPFVALTIPATFTAALLTLRSPGRRVRYFLLTCLLAVTLIAMLQPRPGQPNSTAALGEVAVCGGFALLTLVPVRLRRAVMVGALVAVILAAIRRGALPLIAGHFYSTDPTIAQRSFEASQVLQKVRGSAWAFLWGYGPGGTVNLAASPDATTLASSGRELFAVDDVHLLTAYVTLKLGLVGLVWLVLVLAAVWRVAWAVVSQPSIDVWDVAILLFVAAGVVVALPAATNLLVNPLVPLLLGLLWQRWTGARLEAVATSARGRQGSAGGPHLLKQRHRDGPSSR